MNRVRKSVLQNDRSRQFSSMLIEEDYHVDELNQLNVSLFRKERNDAAANELLLEMLHKRLDVSQPRK